MRNTVQARNADPINQPTFLRFSTGICCQPKIPAYLGCLTSNGRFKERKSKLWKIPQAYLVTKPKEFRLIARLMAQGLVNLLGFCHAVMSDRSSMLPGVTDPQSPLHKLAEEAAGSRFFFLRSPELKKLPQRDHKVSK